ncbi:unnamed protein product [Ilex paraguariensis]|uniref:Uncharacterized protein n=1 Tax=Ilex paraguariensis TaxID=185542 RepID=A0ABC8R3L1_9AQUA
MAAISPTSLYDDNVKVPLTHPSVMKTYKGESKNYSRPLFIDSQELNAIWEISQGGAKSHQQQYNVALFQQHHHIVPSSGLRYIEAEDSACPLRHFDKACNLQPKGNLMLPRPPPNHMEYTSASILGRALPGSVKNPNLIRINLRAGLLIVAVAGKMG